MRSTEGDAPRGEPLGDRAPGHEASCERWTICAEGHVHWGAGGGAGLLLRYVPPSGPPQYLLEQRSRWVDEGGSWGMPGGAIRSGESPEQAADREAREELWPIPSYRVTGVEAQDCGGGWCFQIVGGDVDEPVDMYLGREVDAVGWFTVDQMQTLPLHSGFRHWVDDQRHVNPRPQ